MCSGRFCWISSLELLCFRLRSLLVGTGCSISKRTSCSVNNTRTKARSQMKICTLLAWFKAKSFARFQLVWMPMWEFMRYKRFDDFFTLCRVVQSYCSKSIGIVRNNNWTDFYVLCVRWRGKAGNLLHSNGKFLASKLIKQRDFKISLALYCQEVIKN